jgi:hypothetical protein
MVVSQPSFSINKTCLSIFYLKKKENEWNNIKKGFPLYFVGDICPEDSFSGLAISYCPFSTHLFYLLFFIMMKTIDTLDTEQNTLSITCLSIFYLKKKENEWNNIKKGFPLYFVGDICPEGYYCEIGSSKPTPCGNGTYMIMMKTIDTLDTEQNTLSIIYIQYYRIKREKKQNAKTYMCNNNSSLFKAN